MYNVPEILNNVIAKLGVNKTQFAVQCGIKPQALQSYFNGTTKRLKHKFAYTILKGFPNVNLKYLLYGEMPILTGVSVDSNEQNNEGNALQDKEKELLKAEIKLKDGQIKLKDEQIKLKDEQIKMLKEQLERRGGELITRAGRISKLTKKNNRNNGK